MNLIYLNIPGEEQSLAVQALYATKCLSKGCIADSSQTNFRKSPKEKMPIWNAASDFVLAYTDLLGSHNCLATSGKYECQVRKENPMTVTLSRLSELMSDDAEYDETFLSPNDKAYSFAKEILEKCKDEAPQDVMAASPAPIGDGGVFVEWETTAGCVRLIVPPDLTKAYLYFQKGSEKEIRRDVSSNTLIELLKAIAQHEQTHAETE